MTMTISSRLSHWDDLADEFEWTGLLVGNGASIAVSRDFKYSSLHNVARSDDLAQPLTATDVAFFDAMRTTDFEEVLSALSIAGNVATILEESTEQIDERYESIRQALVQAVRAVHVGWRYVPDSTLETIGRHLRTYEYVYSTNYDLLLYWSIMNREARGFRDYFFGESFDVTDTEIWDGRYTKVLYLHGGLHLYRSRSGGTLKRAAGGSGVNLLDLFGMPYRGAVPLFVTEGNAEQKLRAIGRSDYLSFAYSRFQEHEGPLVAFGHSLGASDAHIVSAMANWEEPIIAIGLMPTSSARLIERKASLRRQLRGRLMFFDARTHPLGDASLNVDADI